MKKGFIIAADSDAPTTADDINPAAGFTHYKEYIQ